MTSNNTAHPSNLDQLFPEPSLPPSQLCPQRLPGANLDSLAALQYALKDNHKCYHIFFNDGGFHNHITHRVLAIYALGGSAQIIKDYYEHDGRIQRPAFQSPESITEENFFDHLGDQKYYQAYLSFFFEQVSKRGVAGTLEEFIFSEKYNFQKGRNPNEQPEMLGRFISGILHPLIHVGYGLEFGLNGMLIEGLALTAVHDVLSRPSLSPSLFASGAAIQNIASRLSSLGQDAVQITGTPIVSKTGGVHAFDIVARILRDDRLNRKVPIQADQIVKFLVECNPIIEEYADQWTVDLTQPGEVERKMEELIWLSSLVYGVGGLRPNGHQSDFFLMHLVTSSLFLPSLVAFICPQSQVLLLRAYLVSALSTWVLRGRPVLKIKSFMETTAVQPSISTTTGKEPHSANLVANAPPTTETTPTPNPFLPVLQSTITHPMDHVIKIQRAFAHFDTIYGTRAAGYFKGTELEGAELLDGSLFLRSALLTMDYVGWAREGQEARQFSFEGF